MFVNIMRADFYRFIRSRFAKTIIPAFALVIGVFSLFVWGEGSFSFGGVIGEKDGVALIDGFRGFAFADPDNPQFWELVYSASCFGIVALFAMVITMTTITTADDRSGISKLAVAAGQPQVKLFCSKLVVGLLVTGVLWFVHNGLTMGLTLLGEHQSLTGDQVRTWLGFVAVQFCLYTVVMLLGALVALLTSSRVVSLVLILVLIMGDLIAMSLGGDEPGRVFETLTSVNPLRHVNRISRYWAEPELLTQAWILVAVAIPLLLAACVAWLRRRELS
ncbi:ABC transporter permease subunit [Propionibacterium australiense]|uniref:Uncharacterized protein n=1 Tax=Propionibacterium australiense TaxID=119981 RepID=A0A383S9R4_9ACTN|nr:ABC transporter permease subunit [Propionibacterium australiense]RLP06736.1 hypothetical protein D7U36_12265 [Propionibacterium australiense]RLP07505.1 hypothetical protein D9T14_10325 [Propionibacterium australiense]SYZ34109.1 Hypothetical protein PROPAUS_2111 [Propionibacterium australiense]VEH88698.1 ABC-type transport system involved in multi-copper enzyme maturation, permease component [Propionibacterium australiense]